VATKRNDLLGRLADLSEEAIQRLSDVPGADKALTAINSLRERTDELQKRVRGLEGLEARIVELERKVDKLQKGSSSGVRSAAKKTTTTKSSSSKQSK
jgi:cell division protein FtsB